LIIGILILFANLKFIENLEQKNKNVIFSLKDYIYKIIFSANDNSTNIKLMQLLFKTKINKRSFFFFSVRSFAVTMIFINLLVSLNNIFEYWGFSIWGNIKYFTISNILFLSIVVLFIVVFYIIVKKKNKKKLSYWYSEIKKSQYIAE
jgi:type IV secretory pathway VirB3-like protein